MILDGENAWEHYAGGGRPFLRALYGGLEACPDIQTVTMTEAAAGQPARRAAVDLSRVVDQRRLLHLDWPPRRPPRVDATGRAALGVRRPRRLGVAEARERAFEEILVAEGSDWFWWYGDDHSSDHDREFDDLFRRHLRNAYAALDVPVPDELHVSNITTGPGPDRLAPLELGSTSSWMGVQTSDGEWAGAAGAPLTRPAGAMHEVASPSLVAEALRRPGLGSLCLCLDGRVAGLVAANSVALAIVVSDPEPRRIVLDRRWVAADAIVEIAIPFDVIGARPGAELGVQYPGLR